MKAHIGVDAKSGLTHSTVTTAANEHDLNQLGNLLHGGAICLSRCRLPRSATARGAGRGGCGLADRRASRQGKNLKQHPRKNKTAINIEYMKASIRAVVEHPFRIIKRQFGFVKARYKGLLKTITNWRCYSPANLFRGPNDTSVGEISVKPEITPEMVEK
ncbi:transposase [Klebsiella pneumoniae]